MDEFLNYLHDLIVKPNMHNKKIRILIIGTNIFDLPIKEKFGMDVLFNSKISHYLTYNEYICLYQVDSTMTKKEIMDTVTREGEANFNKIYICDNWASQVLYSWMVENNICDKNNIHIVSKNNFLFK